LENESLRRLFAAHRGNLVDKWHHYIDVYDRHFAGYRNAAVNFMEIGVFHGGSLQLWKKYFGARASILGVDVDPHCKTYEEEQIRVEIGNQADPGLWQSIASKYGQFEIVVDDGSHINADQISTFLNLWPHLKDGGIYVVEDCHTSYWADYGGGFKHPFSFMEFSKHLTDRVNANWSRDPNSFSVDQFTNEIGCVSFYDSMVVFEKKIRATPPLRVCAGNPSREIPEEGRAIVDEGRRNLAKLKWSEG